MATRRQRNPITIPADRIPAVRSERIRETIKAGQAVTRLKKLVNGEIEMTPQAVRAACFLINKVVPDAVAARDTEDRDIRDVSHRDPHALLRVIEGEVERRQIKSDG